MLRKPWPILILALIHILAPLFNALLSAAIWHLSLADYFSTLVHRRSLLVIAVALLINPIAGIAIYAVKKWSYLVFVLCVAIGFYDNYQAHLESPLVVKAGTLLTVFGVDLLIVGYFLLGSVREIYFNPRVRWWESKPRYLVNLSAAISMAGRAAEKVGVTDFAEGGVFFVTTAKFSLGDVVTFQMDIPERGQSLSCQAKLVHQKPGLGGGFGAQFAELTKEQRRAIREIIRGMVTAGVKTRTEAKNWREDLFDWLKTLLFTGKGLTPGVRKPPSSP